MKPSSVSPHRRIVMLLPNNPYPQDVRVRREAESLTEAGFDVTVICPRFAGQRRRETVASVVVRRYWLPVEGSGALSYLVEYATVTMVSLVGCIGLLVRRKLDVVHIHNPPDTLVVAGAIVKLFGKRFVFDHHDLAPELYEARFGARARPLVSRTLRGLEKASCKLADHVITTNESYRQLEQERDGIGLDRITIVRNGPPPRVFEAARADPHVRRGAEILICYAGAMGPQDGIDYLIRALNGLVNDLGRRDVQCHILGDGDAAAAAIAMTRELGLERNVHFTGWLLGDEYLSHLAAADICVEPAPSNPYNERSTTIKILEYMALGKPIVAFDLAEHRVSAGDAGVYVTPNDEMEMAKAIADLCDHPERRAEMGAVGLQRTRDQLSWAYSAPALLRAYGAITGGSIVTIAAEDRLLLATAHTALSPREVAAVVDLVSGPIDWDYFVEISIRHAVAPLVHAALEQVIDDAPEAFARIPAAPRDDLRRLYEGSTARNARLFAVLGDIVRAFDDAGVFAVGLKDVQLAVDVYPERGLRPMGDVDVLIHHEDFERVERAMAGLGFAPHPRPRAPFVLKYGSGRQLRRRRDETWVDVQWDVAEREWDPAGLRPFGARAERLWERSVPLHIDDYALLAPCPEDMLLHLCLHLEGHEDCELVLFSDIVEFLRHYRTTFDWSRFVEYTREADAESSVHHVLKLTALLFGVGLPEGTLEALIHPYFAAQLYSPLFGNLTPLHQSLDDIEAEASPPEDVMASFELLARRQSAAATSVYLELDGLAEGFMTRGGTSLTFYGTPPRRVFPDPGMAPFEPVHAFIVADDLDLLRSVLDDADFVRQAGTTIAQKQLRNPRLCIDVAVSTDLRSAVAACEPNPVSNRRAALDSLLPSRRRGDAGPQQTLSAAVIVHALSPEELVGACCIHLGRRSHDVSALFYAFSCVELPAAALTDSADAEVVAQLGMRVGAVAQLRDGLDIVESLQRCSSWAARILRHLPETDAHPSPLEWARYGPDALSRSPELRPAFLWLLSLKSVSTATRKARFLAHSLRSRGDEPAPLLDVFGRALRGIRASSAPKSTRELCYWVEPRE